MRNLFFIKNAPLVLNIMCLLSLTMIYRCGDPSDTANNTEYFSTENEVFSDSDETWKVVDIMPMFPGCEKLNGDYKKKKKCTQQEMLHYIYREIKYPAEARENGVEGQVVVSFIVEKNGDITNVEILRDKGSGLGEEAARAVRTMNDMEKKWSPGIENGKIVRVVYNLPVQYKLE